MHPMRRRTYGMLRMPEFVKRTLEPTSDATLCHAERDLRLFRKQGLPGEPAAAGRACELNTYNASGSPNCRKTHCMFGVCCKEVEVEPPEP